MNGAARCALLLSILVLGFGCATQKATTGEVRIKAYIDGSDVVKLNGSRIWYEHGAFELPGRWRGANEPTYVDGAARQPEWMGRVSKPFGKVSPPFPGAAVSNVELVKHAGRGAVSIGQMPTPQNNYTLAVCFDDNEPDGADWYDVAIRWQTQIAGTRSSAP